MIAELAPSHRCNNTVQIHCRLRQVYKFLFDPNQGILISRRVHEGNSFSKFCESARVTEPNPPNFLKGRLRVCLIITSRLGDELFS